MQKPAREFRIWCTPTDWVCILGTVLIFLALAELQQSTPSLNWLGHDKSGGLGAEYNSIALAIRHGRGFSDPFGVRTGSTAWMAPGIPYFLAGLYWLCSDNAQQVKSIVAFLYVLAIIQTGSVLSSVARGMQRVALGRFIFVALLLVHFSDVFLADSDGWLILILANGLWMAYSYPRKLTSRLTWGIFGGLVALCSPVLGFLWAVMVTWEHLLAPWLESRRKPVRSDMIRWLLVASVSVAVVSPWLVRTRIAVGGWYPIKSNSSFEFWQSQLVDDDGVLDHRTLHQHPWASGWEQRGQYQDLGEAGFLAAKRKQTWAAVQNAPMNYVRRAANRALAAWGWPPRSNGPTPPTWLAPILYIISLLPFAAAAFLILMCKTEQQAVFSASILYCIYLLPYILISFDRRYVVALLGIKMLLVLFAADHILRWSSSLRQRRSLTAKP